MSNGVEDRLNYLEETKRQIRQSINNLGGTIEDNTPFSDYPEQIQHIIDTSIIPQSELDALVEETININGEESPVLPYLENITAGSIYQFMFQDIPVGINDYTIENIGNYFTNEKIIIFDVNNHDINDWLNIYNTDPNLVPLEDMTSSEITFTDYIIGVRVDYPYSQQNKNHFIGYVGNWFVTNQELSNEYNLHNVGWYKFPEGMGAYNFYNHTPTNAPIVSGITGSFYVYTNEGNFIHVNSTNTENFRYMFKSIQVTNLPIRPNT